MRLVSFIANDIGLISVNPQCVVHVRELRVAPDKVPLSEIRLTHGNSVIVPGEFANIISMINEGFEDAPKT